MTFDLADFAERISASVNLTAVGKTFVATDLAVGEYGLAVLDTVSNAAGSIPASIVAELRSDFVGKGYLSDDDEKILVKRLRANSQPS